MLQYQIFQYACGNPTGFQIGRARGNGCRGEFKFRHNHSESVDSASCSTHCREPFHATHTGGSVSSRRTGSSAVFRDRIAPGLIRLGDWCRVLDRWRHSKCLLLFEDPAHFFRRTSHSVRDTQGHRGDRIGPREIGRRELDR